MPPFKLVAGDPGTVLDTTELTWVPITEPAVQQALNAGLVLSADLPPDPEPTRDERLLAAVAAAKTAVAGGAFTQQQAATLQAVFDGLGAAITRGSS